MSTSNGFAHFGMLIPSDSMIMQEDNKTVTLTLSFSHPFEGQGTLSRVVSGVTLYDPKVLAE